MGVLYKESEADQLELNLVQSNEKPEVIALINSAREDDNEHAWEVLYTTFSKLLHGDYVRSMLRFNTESHSVNREDYDSIMNLIFVEAVKCYKPEKAKFITHLTNRIRHKFWEYLLRERMIPVRNNKAPKEILKILESTECHLYSDTMDYIKDDKRGHKYARFTKSGEDYEMPLDVFIDVFIFGAVESTVPAKHVDMVEFLFGKIRQGYNDAYLLTSKKFGISSGSVHYYVNQYFQKIHRNLGISNVSIVLI